MDGQGRGYINITIESLETAIPQAQMPQPPMSLTLKFGEATTKSQPGKWTNSYLFKVPKEVPRLGLQLSYWGIEPSQPGEEPEAGKEAPQKQTLEPQEVDVLFGDCRMQISPFLEFQGRTHVFQAAMTDSKGKTTANLKLKLTFYKANHGKLKIRILNLLLSQSIAQRQKSLTVRFRLGPFIKTSPVMVDSESWKQPLQLVVLSETLNLSVELLSGDQLIGEYVVYNISKEGLLSKQPKVMECGLYWDQKSSGKMKYEVQNTP